MVSMSPLKNYTKTVTLIIAMCWVLTACSTSRNQAGESVYQPSVDPMQDVQLGLNTAKAQNKLLLVVMGAQWCHDSRTFAENLKHQRLSKILSKQYHIVFIDVAYYNDLRAITQRFEQAHYYATPTIMIIDPQTERLVNASDMHIWGAADSIALADYIAYFEGYANNPLPAYYPIPAKHAASIMAFEQEHSARLMQAYNFLVPGMKAEDKTGEANEAFYQHWGEVRQYRASLQKDIQVLRTQAIEQANLPLTLPTYPAFSWEE